MSAETKDRPPMCEREYARLEKEMHEYWQRDMPWKRIPLPDPWKKQKELRRNLLDYYSGEMMKEIQLSRGTVDLAALLKKYEGLIEANARMYTK